VCLYPFRSEDYSNLTLNRRLFPLTYSDFSSPSLHFHPDLMSPASCATLGMRLVPSPLAVNFANFASCAEPGNGLGANVPCLVTASNQSTIFFIYARRRQIRNRTCLMKSLWVRSHRPSQHQPANFGESAPDHLPPFRLDQFLNFFLGLLSSAATFLAWAIVLFSNSAAIECSYYIGGLL
jgi:hypothetical protein